MAAVNPIIPGFAPDPSVVKVGEWYYLVNSTFHIYPGLPIYASQDLASWKHIGNAIDRPGQLRLAKSRTNLVPLEAGEVLLATGGLYAPTIRFYEGTFYIVCTNLVHVDPPRTENFIISTTDIWKGRWSDPVYFDFDGIDPSLLFDGGKVYVQGSRGPGPKTRIQQFEVDIATGEKLSDERTIWNGTGGDWAEGPHVYRRDGWYYLVISEGGTHEGHMVTAARSRDVWGPYQACPDNPILTAKGTGEYVQHTGHCDMFEDGEGNWWGVCLAARKDGKGRYVMGRESFLTRGSWDGGWPSLDRVTLSPEGVARSEGPALSAAPGVDLVYIRDPELRRYSLSEDFSSATLTSSTTDLPHPEDSPTFLGKRQRRLEGTSIVTIHHPGGPSWAWLAEDSAKGRSEESDSVTCLPSCPSSSPCAQAAKGRSSESDSVTCLPAHLSCLSSCSPAEGSSSAKGALEEREGVLCVAPGAGAEEEEEAVVMEILKVPDLEGRRETSFRFASKVERSSWAYCFFVSCVPGGGDGGMYGRRGDRLKAELGA